jgi:hypothetical protein
MLTTSDLTRAIEQSHAALGAILTGDPSVYQALYSPADDVTLGESVRAVRMRSAESRADAALADRIVSCVWRLRRLLVFEVGVFEVERPSETDRLLRTLGEAEPTSPTAALGLVFIGAAKNSADPLTKLSRYETTLERSFYRALHELQRLQAVRAGRDVSLPTAVDVERTGRSGNPQSSFRRIGRLGSLVGKGVALGVVNGSGVCVNR